MCFARCPCGQLVPPERELYVKLYIAKQYTTSVMISYYVLDIRNEVLDTTYQVTIRYILYIT